MREEFLKLEDQLCFSIYACSHAITKAYHPLLQQLDLTYTQYLAMLVLWEQKRLSVKEVGERLHLDSGTLTPLLKKMEAKGLILRERCQKDERCVLVSATPQGMALREKALAVPRAVSCKAGISPEEAKIMYKLLHKILGALQEEK